MDCDDFSAGTRMCIADTHCCRGVWAYIQMKTYANENIVFLQRARELRRLCAEARNWLINHTSHSNEAELIKLVACASKIRYYNKVDKDFFFVYVWSGS